MMTMTMMTMRLIACHLVLEKTKSSVVVVVAPVIDDDDVSLMMLLFALGS